MVVREEGMKVRDAGRKEGGRGGGKKGKRGERKHARSAKI